MEELLWTNPEWKHAALTWVRDQLEEIGRDIGGEISQPHIRPWSTAFRVPTRTGDVWFKAGTAALAHEPRLTEFLAGLLPEHCPEVLAIHGDRGWMLTKDFGLPLRSAIRRVSDLHLWHQALESYALLQQRAAERTDELVATAVIDNRIPALHAAWTELVRDEPTLMVGEEGGLAPAAFDFAQSLWPHIEEAVANASVSGIPDTVVHEDLHDANVFLDDGRVILADWGDSSICNPLTTLTVFQSSAAYRRGLEIDSPEITRLRDVYLRAWGEYAPLEQIQKAVPAARHIGALHRALSWRRAMQSAPPHTTREWADAVPGWLDEFLSGFAGYPGPRIP